jgi:hypothetical protein
MTNAPSAEYQQHGAFEEPKLDEAAFRPFWRRRDRLEKLYATGLITSRELRAAIAFRTAWEVAHRGTLHAAPWDVVRLDRHCRRPPPGPGEHQLAALRRLAAVRQALGALYELLRMAVLEEMSWCEIGRRLDVHHKTAKDWTCAAIAALAAL